MLPDPSVSRMRWVGDLGGATSPPKRIGMLIADDLTGACDAGAKFAKAGFRSMYVVNSAQAFSCDTEVLCVSTESRSSSPGESARRVAETSRHLNKVSTNLIIKKIDSLLRGNIVPEVESARQSFAMQTAILTPAFPSLGRTVSGGWLNVFGSPDRSVHIPALFREQGARDVAWLPRFRELDLLRKALAECLRNGNHIIVADAECPQDLALLVEAGTELHEGPLWVGSAGLVGALAEHIAGKRQIQRMKARCSMEGRSVVLFIGSNEEMTISQLAYLLQRRVVEKVRPSTCDLSRSRQALLAGHHLLVLLERETHTERDVQSFFAALDRNQLGGLILSGGDTATVVCRALRTSAISLCGEIAEGIPWGIAVGGLAGGITVSTKSGAFGQQGSLDEMVEFLSGSRFQGTDDARQQEHCSNRG